MKIKSIKNSVDTEYLVARTLTVNFDFCDPTWPDTDPGLYWTFKFGDTTDDPLDGKFRFTEFTMDRSGCSLNDVNILNVPVVLGTVITGKVAGQR